MALPFHAIPDWFSSENQGGNVALAELTGGQTALFIFMISGIVPRLYGLFHIADGVNAKGGVLYKGLKEWMYDHIFSPAFGMMNGSLAYAIFNILLFWCLCYWLDKKKIYIKV